MKGASERVHHRLPDNEVPCALDEKRMASAIGDVIDSRWPLSRWHQDWAVVEDGMINLCCHSASNFRRCGLRTLARLPLVA